MKYTVWVDFDYCSGLFDTKVEAEEYANKLTKEHYNMTDEQVKGYDNDDWEETRDSCNILPIRIEIEVAE